MAWSNNAAAPCTVARQKLLMWQRPGPHRLTWQALPRRKSWRGSAAPRCTARQAQLQACNVASCSLSFSLSPFFPFHRCPLDVAARRPPTPVACARRRRPLPWLHRRPRLPTCLSLHSPADRVGVNPLVARAASLGDRPFGHRRRRRGHRRPSPSSGLTPRSSPPCC
jgi:hypothetical protein